MLVICNLFFPFPIGGGGAGAAVPFTIISIGTNRDEESREESALESPHLGDTIGS